MILKDFQLRNGMSLFFVIKPVAFEPGDQAMGQRFFGHYPSGQFRFRDGHVAIKSGTSEFMLRNVATPGAWNLIAYRLGNGVAPEASIGGAPLSKLEAVRGEAQVP